MKNLLFILIFLFPLIAVSQDMDKEILTMREFTVKLGHNSQFQEGVKMWIACYNENGGENKFEAWQRVHGDKNVYTITGRRDNWAAFDEDDSAGSACSHVYLNFILPHIESNSFNLATTMPEISRESRMDGRTKVLVHHFRINNDTEFNAIAKELSKTLKESEGSLRGTWFNVFGGGSTNAHYFVSVPFINFSGLDDQTDGIWKVYEDVHGKTKADALRARWRACITDYWFYLYSLNKELSNL